LSAGSPWARAHSQPPMARTPTTLGAPGPIGPRDRESFLNAQRRNRRATWRVSVLCVLSALVMGIPLTLVLTPLVYVGTLILAQIMNYFFPLPTAFWQDANTLGRLAVAVGDYLFNHKPLDPDALALGITVVLGPGLLITLGLWMGMRALFERGGVGGTLTTLNAREPNKNDLKELQLTDVVAEMAIAAGLPAPRVMVLESPGANAAAIGASPADACVLVSRRLLEDLNRDEIQAVLADLIGSIGNGDLRIAFTVTTVFETCGLLLAMINAPFGPHARGALWRIVRYGFNRSKASGKAAEADAVAGLLTRSLDSDSDDIAEFFDSTKKKKSLARKVLSFALFPIFFTNAAMRLTLWFFSNVLLGPSIALLWRTRRYLADSSAVELTRYPDGLASALGRLSRDNAAIPGGEWASHLFVISPLGDSSLGPARPGPEEMRAAVSAWSSSQEARAATGANPATISAAPAESRLDTTGYERLRTEFVSTVRAATQGDARAISRLTAFERAWSPVEAGQAFINMPDFADITAARQGDRAAIGRLRAFSQKQRATQSTNRESTGLQSASLLSFHPPLKRRLKRLERMGAHVSPDSPEKSSVSIAVVILWLVVGPLLLLAAVLMLLVIAMMAMLNLMLLALWLGGIQAIFLLLGHR
jgi:Zn-dependent protease with chaperone function